MIEAVESDWSDFFEHLRGLRGEDADEDDVAFTHDPFVVKFCDYVKFLNEGTKQVWLSGGNH